MRYLLLSDQAICRRAFHGRIFFLAGLPAIIIIMAVSLSTCREPAVPVQDNPEKLVVSLASELEHMLMIDRLPQFRDNSAMTQISSYDTTGGNNDGFSGLYSFLRKENGKMVLADLKGPGVINRIWTPTPLDDTIAFYIDGEQEPRIKLPFSDLFSGEVFPFIPPVAGNEVGGYYCYVPIPYRESCKIVFYGPVMYFHQIQYRTYGPDTQAVSFPVVWTDEEKQLLQKVCALWSGRQEGLPGYLQDTYPGLMEKKVNLTLAPGDSRTIFGREKGGRIVSLEIQPSEVFSGLYKDILLEATWDDEQQPAILCPVADFFGYAYGTTSMQSLLVGSKDGINYYYLPMPFKRNARLRLIYKERTGTVQERVNITVTIGYADVPKQPSEGRFYTCWRREIGPEAGKPYVFLEVKGRGHYVGTILQAQGLRPGSTGFFEGDDSTVVDGVMRFHGTGSEDYFNGGWYAVPYRWDRAFSLPLHGCLDYSISYARTGGYRFYLSDKIPWQKSFLHTIEHGPVGNLYPVDYTSLAMYYADAPPAEIMQPADTLREVYLHDTLVITPILMDITVGLDAKAGFRDWNKLIITGNDDSRVRINLGNLQDGRYNMMISFLAHPGGSTFSVWQRQKRISGSISTSAQEDVLKENFEAGEIVIDDFYRSLTLELEPPAAGSQLKILQLAFVRQNW